MRRLLLYYLAFIVAIVEVIMFVSVILAPLALWLRNESDWFKDPFNTVGIADRDIDTMKKSRAIEKERREREEKK